MKRIILIIIFICILQICFTDEIIKLGKDIQCVTFEEQSISKLESNINTFFKQYQNYIIISIQFTSSGADSRGRRHSVLIIYYIKKDLF